MVRSIYSAISGLRNHQVELDIIGNNISNVNTTGFKAGRVTFEESMAQLLKGSSRPPGFQGGTNPIQVGLGMSIGSIDTLTTQGNLESTGQITDLAIEGNSFFVVSNGEGNYYSRNGAFQFDSNGRMVLPTNGFVLQGKMAADDGSFPAGTKVGDIQIPFTTQAAANETTYVSYQGNLNSDSEALGTILYTQPFYHKVDEFNTSAITGGVGQDNGYGNTGTAHEAVSPSVGTGDITTNSIYTSSTKLTGLHNGSGQSLGIKVGDKLTVSATIYNSVAGADETYEATFEVVEDPANADTTIGNNQYKVATLSQFLICMQDFIADSPSWGGGGGSYASGAVVGILPDGKIRIENVAPPSTQAIENLTVTSDRPISTTYVSNAFSFSSTISSGSYADTPERILRPSKAADTIYDYNLLQADGTTGYGSPSAQIFDASGDIIDVENGDTFNLNALVGENPKNANSLTFDQGTGTAGTATTMQEVMTYIRNTLNLPEYDGTIKSNESVSLNAVGTEDDQIPEGAMVIRGQPETAFAINNFTFQADNADPNTDPPTLFNTNMVTTQLQAARNTGVYDTSIEIYDESGMAHTITMTYTHTGIKNPGTWNWEISTNGGETIQEGRTGQITFGQDGTPSSFTFDDSGVSSIKIDPNNGARMMEIDIDWGEPGNHEGITQYQSETTVAAVEQDGYPSGRLEEISVDEFGVIAGSFSNGVSKALAQILIADFRNPGGLLRKGDSIFSESSNSGSAVLGKPGVSSSGVIKPGALELSNVEMSTEFTNMITTQRGYQANARVITTSDEMLQELVNLVR